MLAMFKIGKLFRRNYVNFIVTLPTRKRNVCTYSYFAQYSETHYATEISAGVSRHLKIIANAFSLQQWIFCVRHAASRRAHSKLSQGNRCGKFLYSPNSTRLYKLGSVIQHLLMDISSVYLGLLFQRMQVPTYIIPLIKYGPMCS